jgi:hypothetical protein
MAARDWEDSDEVKNHLWKRHQNANFGVSLKHVVFSKKEIPNLIRPFTNGVPVVYGLVDGKALQWKREGREFFYVDHSYFQRSWKYCNFRLIRNGIHLTRVIPNDIVRLGKFSVDIAPWRKNGNHVVVIEPSPFIREFYDLPEDIADRMAEEVKQHTDREVVVKRGKQALPEALYHAWACVCPVSVAGVEAAILGVPVFSTPNCPSWPISAGELKDIERPVLKDREAWANSLAWSSFNEHEAHLIDYRNYQCE